jgi:hypothetical protein
MGGGHGFAEEVVLDGAQDGADLALENAGEKVGRGIDGMSPLRAA